MKIPFERGWSAPRFYSEIGQSSWRIWNGQSGLEWPLQRLPDGHLTSSCKDQAMEALRTFFQGQASSLRARVFCAINARGVSLRRLALPSATKENVRRLLELQIESEFPLPPEELAWGYCPLRTARSPGNGAVAQQEFLVAAVKREVLKEYSEMLAACGVTAVFTVAALVRSGLCPQMPGTGAVLDVGRNHSELLLFKDGAPAAVRVLGWGAESLTLALQQQFGVSHAEAEELKLKSETGDGLLAPKIAAVIDAALDDLARAINGHAAGERCYLTGRGVRHHAVAPGLERRLGPGIRCQVLEPVAHPGCSAAVVALKQAVESGGGAPLVILDNQPANGHGAIGQPVPWKWAGLAAALVLGLLLLPYIEALVLKPFLARKVARIQADQSRMGLLDSEWTFLQYLKQNQPPYLDALFVMSKSAPQGMKIDALSMNRRGEVSLRGSLRTGQQVTEFRDKLIDSGLFSGVSVEEQAPTPDHQKVNVRISAQWKPLSARMALVLGPTAEEIEQAKNRPRNTPGAPPMMPPGMSGPPPGMVPPRSIGPGPVSGGPRPMPAPGGPSIAGPHLP